MDEVMYFSRCYQRLKQIEAPISGWRCEMVIDHGTDNFTCELCGCKKVRYIHVMVHSKYRGDFKAGCICAGLMEDDILAAKERDYKAKLCSKRKSNFFKKKWEAVSDDCWQLKYKGRKLKIERCAFRGHIYFKLVINENQYQWKNNLRMTSFLPAQHLAFDLIDDNIE